MLVDRSIERVTHGGHCEAFWRRWIRNSRASHQGDKDRRSNVSESHRQADEQSPNTVWSWCEDGSPIVAYHSSALCETQYRDRLSKSSGSGLFYATELFLREDLGCCRSTKYSVLLFQCLFSCPDVSLDDRAISTPSSSHDAGPARVAMIVSNTIADANPTLAYRDVEHQYPCR